MTLVKNGFRMSEYDDREPSGNSMTTTASFMSPSTGAIITRTQLLELDLRDLEPCCILILVASLFHPRCILVASLLHPRCILSGLPLPLPFLVAAVIRAPANYRVVHLVILIIIVFGAGTNMEAGGQTCVSQTLTTLGRDRGSDSIATYRSTRLELFVFVVVAATDVVAMQLRALCQFPTLDVV